MKKNASSIETDFSSLDFERDNKPLFSYCNFFVQLTNPSCLACHSHHKLSKKYNKYGLI